MKAAVIHQFGAVPDYEEFPDPAPIGQDVLIQVRAVALENFDKMTAAGTHYASQALFPAFPAIVGHSGVGALPDGRLAAFGGITPPYGALAEKAVVPERYRAYLTPLPEGVSASVAAALPAAALTSLLPLKYGATLQGGESVLINGATGVSGKLAIQIARLLRAGRVVGTGRDPQRLHALREIGADAVIDLRQPEESLTRAFLEEAGNGYDVILDFLWGRPTELLLGALVPRQAGFASHRTRFVQIGEAAGPGISLRAEMLRTSGVEMSGAGSLSPKVVPEAMGLVWEWIKAGRLRIDIDEVPLSKIAEAWQQKTEGRRLVIVP